MDENKDFTTPENTENTIETDIQAEDTIENAQETVEAVPEEAAETIEETAETAEATADLEGATAEELAEAPEANGEIAPEADGEIAPESSEQTAPSKKKPILMTTIVISLVIVIIAVIAALAVKLFFNNDISGTWHLVREVQVMDDGATSDEATHSLDVDYYFDFKSDGSVSSTIGTVTGNGTYTTSKNEDGSSVVTMNIYDILTQYFLDGDYTYELSGNFITGRKMKFTSVNNPELVYEFETASYKAPEIKREEEFTPNDDIIGTWTYNTGEFKLVYEFNKDGTAKYTEQAMSINPYTYSYINIDICMAGLYNVSNDNITITYYFLEQADRNMKFRLDGDTLYINDYPFTKDGAATVDQAQEAAPAQ